MQSFKNRFSIVLSLLLLVFIFPDVKAQSIKDYPLINSIIEITKDSPDTCRINAHVESFYNCPPCPKGMICKPCPGNFIMVSDSMSGTKQFRVFVNKTAGFLTGKEYSFIIHLYKYNSQKEVYEGKLIEQ
ncbi:MAG: hypothetical protein ACHQF0_00855 [Chitinophagales bacterium]